MKKTGILLIAAMALSLGACQTNSHFEEDMPQDERPDKYPTPDGQGFLGNDLTWEDFADIKSEITHLQFTVTGAGGVKEIHEFNSPSDASEWMLPLPVGDYDVLVAANMDTSNGFELSETAPTKVSHTLPTTYAKLINASSNPSQTWNGIGRVTVEKDQMATVHLDLDRLLSLFTLKIKNVPERTTIDVSLRNVASYVTLTEEYAPGHWGRPSEEISEDIILGRLTASNAASAIEEFKVFPTASGVDKTILLFHIRTGYGLELDCEAEAPRMVNGNKYVLEMDYDTISPFMFITSAPINDWTDGWSIDGEILNPATK